MATTKAKARLLKIDGVTIEDDGTGVLVATKPVLQGLTHPTVSIGGVFPFYTIDVLLLTDGGLAKGSGVPGNGVYVLLADASLVSGSSGINVQLADTSLATSGSGVAVNLAATSGLQTSSGLLVRGLRNPSSDPGTVANGDTWYNTTSDIPKIQSSTFTAQLPVILQAKAAGTAIANSNAFAALNTGVTTPANFWKVGRTIRVKYWGNYVATGSSPTLILGAFVDNANSLGAGPTISLTTATSGRWYFESTFTCLVTGSSNTIYAGGYGYCEVAGGTVQFFVLGATLNVNTANSLLCQAVAKWSAASVSNSVQCQGEEICLIG